jgi:Uma2 family endonuclease
MMVAEFGLITADEFEIQLADNPDLRAELIDGMVVVSPEPTYLHQFIGPRLFETLQPIASSRRLGYWFNPVNLRLSDFNVFHPDLAFFRFEDRPKLRGASSPSMPTIVVEILSPSSKSRDLRHKRIRYAEAGIGEYWVIDQDRNSIVINVFESSKDYVGHEVREGRIPVGLFAGVVLDMAWIFGEKDFPQD